MFEFLQYDHMNVNKCPRSRGSSAECLYAAVLTVRTEFSERGATKMPLMI